MKPTKYSEVVNAGLILPRKAKYTMRDVNSLIVDSLFQGRETLTVDQAAFVVRCSAVFHGTDFSKAITPRCMDRVGRAGYIVNQSL